MKIKRLLWIILGFIGLGIGAVGVVLPMLPAFPFLLLAAFSFGKSSERLHKWFIALTLVKSDKIIKLIEKCSNLLLFLH